MLGRLDFADFRILSVGPIFPFSEFSCSRDDGISLRIVSCHPTVLSAIASGVHHTLGCELQQLLICVNTQMMLERHQMARHDDHGSGFKKQIGRSVNDSASPIKQFS